MGLLQQLWDMRKGISECWWLSDTCAVNWNAWAAVGTVAAVFAAIFAPALQRLLVRRRANALFALAYRGDLLIAAIKVRRIKKQFPVGTNNDAAWAAEALLSTDKAVREDFAALAEALDVLTSREVDLTKWPAVDLRLAAKIAVAIESARNFQQAALLVTEPGDDPNWTENFATVEKVLRRAGAALEVADDAAVDAVAPLSKQKKLSDP